MLEETLYIEKNKPLTPAEDYTFLREKGMEYLQALSGKVWTDYNLHDPGVTILELLCYAITDIGYRSQFSMADLLTKPGATSPDKTNSFFTAKEIFTTHPITVEDYRRLLIDIVPGLKNVWLEEIDNADFAPENNADDKTYFKTRTQGYAVKVDDKAHELKFVLETNAINDKKLHVHGLYRVKIELDDWETMLADKNLKSNIEQFFNFKRPKNIAKIILSNEIKSGIPGMYETYVRKILHKYRNLCEDFETIAVMKDEQVSVCADIEVHPNTDINKLLESIYKIIYNYASPSLNFYSLQEMLDKGKSIEDIYEGTVPHRGFVDYDELKTRFNKQRLVMYTSDLINLIMNLNGVIAVKKLLLTSINESSGKIIYNAEKYCLHLSDPQNFSFRFKHLDKDNKAINKINFYKANLPFKAKEPDSSFVMKESKEPIMFVNDLPIPNGSNRALDKYNPIQNEFPHVYYSGLDKMPAAEATTLRQAQRMQLKGYLVFFDQILANYLSQLNNISSLYSWNNPTNINSYSYNKLRDINGAGEQLINESALENLSSEYAAVMNDPDKNVERRNRLLDSLLARFNEKFVDYSVFKYSHNSQSLSFNTKKEQVKDKCSFLKNYAVTSANRSHAINIYKNAWLSHLYNLSGYQRYMTSILGLNIYQDHYLAKILRKTTNGEPILGSNGKPIYFDIKDISFDRGFGMHMIEHVLLRPIAVDIDTPDSIEFLSMCCCDDDKEATENDFCADPYSMRMTIVLPGWLNVSIDMEFRKFVNNTLRNNAPAHVAIKICWIGMEQMYEYEKTYVAFMKVLKIKDGLDLNDNNDSDASWYNNTLSDFVHVINNLKNVYPPATLHDCEDGEKDVSGNFANRTVILNRTTLGGGKTPGTVTTIPYQKPYPYDFGVRWAKDDLPPHEVKKPIDKTTVKEPTTKQKKVATIVATPIKKKAARKKEKPSVIDVVINAANKNKIAAAKKLKETKATKKAVAKKTATPKKAAVVATKKPVVKKTIDPIKNKALPVKKVLQTKKKTNKKK
jgi:hypothetical protein